MAKSRMALGLAAAALAAAPAAAPAGAQQNAEQAVEAQRSRLREALRLDCPPAAQGEILVCGSRDETQAQRLAPIEAGPQRAADRAGGEQRAALAIELEPLHCGRPRPAMRRRARHDRHRLHHRPRHRPGDRQPGLANPAQLSCCATAVRFHAKTRRREDVRVSHAVARFPTSLRAAQRRSNPADSREATVRSSPETGLLRYARNDGRTCRSFFAPSRLRANQAAPVTGAIAGEESPRAIPSSVGGAFDFGDVDLPHLEHRLRPPLSVPPRRGRVRLRRCRSSSSSS